MSEMQAHGSLDPHLLQGLASAIHATSIHDTIPHNPFIPTPTLSISVPATGHNPTVVNGFGSSFDWKSTLEPLTPSRPWILLLDDSQTNTFQEYQSTFLLTTIPSDTVSVWGQSFWEGTGGLFPETNSTPVNIYVSANITPLQRTRILDTIYMRSTQGGTLSPNPTVNPLNVAPETPANIATLLHSPDSPAKLKLLSGMITEHITNGWAGLVPPRLQQKLYRTLHKTITLHQNNTWLERNAIMHPDTPFFTPTDYGTKPARKRQLLKDEEANPS
jgi:hypothetical protein